MSELTPAAKTLLLKEEHREIDDKAHFGFWVYIMTDCILFASLFAVYAVLHSNVFGGPSGRQLFSMPYVLTETTLLLTSSFTCGLALLAAQYRHRQKVVFWLGATFLLGAIFLGLEVHEFSHLTATHDSWRRSGFLSAYFTLVGTHGLHITIGLLWMAVMIVRLWNTALTDSTMRRLKFLSVFWHFLDIVWIFIFTIVYLMGVA